MRIENGNAVGVYRSYSKKRELHNMCLVCDRHVMSVTNEATMAIIILVVFFILEDDHPIPAN